MRTGTWLRDVLFVLTMCVPMAQADPPPPCPPLPLGEAINRTPTHPVTGSLGTSLAEEGGLLVVGSPGDLDVSGGQQFGAMYAYALEGETWMLQQRITRDSLPPSSQLGRMIAMSNGLLVSATGSLSPSTPSLQIFRREGVTWVFDSSIGDLRSTPLDLDIENGTIAIITRDNTDTRVDVYERSASTWALVDTISLTALRTPFNPTLELESGRLYVATGRGGLFGDLSLRIYQRGSTGFAQLAVVPMPNAWVSTGLSLAAHRDAVAVLYRWLPPGGQDVLPRLLVIELVNGEWVVHEPAAVLADSNANIMPLTFNGDTVVAGNPLSPFAGVFKRDASNAWQPAGVLDRDSLRIDAHDSLQSPSLARTIFVNDRLMLGLPASFLIGGSGFGAVFAFPSGFNERLTFMGALVVTASQLGEPASITAEVRPTTNPLTYQWFKTGVPLVDDDVIGGTSTPMLTFATLRLEDRGLYTCRVSDGCDERIGPEAILSIPCVLVTGLPPAVRGQGGEPFELSVQVSGLEPFFFEWRRNGIPLSTDSRVSANTRTLRIDPLFLEDEGTYTVGVACSGAVSSTTTTVLTIPSCLGDADGSGVVEFFDVAIVLERFGSSGAVPFNGDTNRDGVVNFLDITTVLANFGNLCQ